MYACVTIGYVKSKNRFTFTSKLRPGRPSPGDPRFSQNLLATSSSLLVILSPQLWFALFPCSQRPTHSPLFGTCGVDGTPLSLSMFHGTTVYACLIDRKAKADIFTFIDNKLKLPFHLYSVNHFLPYIACVMLTDVQGWRRHVFPKHHINTGREALLVSLWCVLISRYKEGPSSNVGDFLDKLYMMQAACISKVLQHFRISLTWFGIISFSQIQPPNTHMLIASGDTNFTTNRFIIWFSFYLRDHSSYMGFSNETGSSILLI